MDTETTTATGPTFEQMIEQADKTYDMIYDAWLAEYHRDRTTLKYDKLCKARNDAWVVGRRLRGELTF